MERRKRKEKKREQARFRDNIAHFSEIMTNPFEWLPTPMRFHVTTVEP